MNKIIYMLFLLFSFSFSYNFSDNELNDILNACYNRCKQDYGANSYSPCIRCIKSCYANCEDDYNEGYAEGGSGGIGDGLAGLLGGGIATKAKGSIKTPSERDIDMGAGGGSRSKAEIMKVVKQRTPGLRHTYNKYLKKKPGFAGKVTLKFTIAPGGEIISIAIASSTTGYGEFDNEIKNAVKRWTFGVIKSGNTTVTLPFTFSE